jgi:hypothetical protein
MIDNSDTYYPPPQQHVEETLILPVNQDANQSPEVSFTRHKQASEEDKTIVPDAPKNESEKPTVIYNPQDMHLPNKDAVRKSSGEFANNVKSTEKQEAKDDIIKPEEIKTEVPRMIEGTPTIVHDTGKYPNRIVRIQSDNRLINPQDNPIWERHQDTQKIIKYKKKICCYLL